MNKDYYKNHRNFLGKVGPYFLSAGEEVFFFLWGQSNHVRLRYD